MLLNPIWLFALAAIGIPVVIHLWNIRPGKTLKVGSIALYSQSSPKSSRSFKLLDILLLLLRCLLLILLAVLLATPLWQRHLQSTKVKGWLLIPKENFNDAYQHFKPTIDSLNKAGYEFHYFDKGFRKANLTEILQHPGKDSVTGQITNYWDLVKQLTRYASGNVEVFTPNTIIQFSGEKPLTNLHINWHSFAPADSITTFLAGAWLTANGNIRVVQGTATSSGTIYQYINVKNGGQSGSLYHITIDHGLPAVNFKNTKLYVDTTTQHMAVYTDKYSLDASYLKAALTAASQFTQRKTIIKTYSQAEIIPAKQDWIFWLSDKPVGQIGKKAKNLFIYEGGKITNSNSWISNTGNDNIPQGQAKIQLYKGITPSKIAGNSLWTNGFGKPVLNFEAGQTNIYHFYSRLNPAFSDLVWSDEFPKWLLDLTDPYKLVGEYDRRGLAADQILPVYTSQTGVAKSHTGYINLTNYLWLALILIFFTERWLATRNKTILVNG